MRHRIKKIPTLSNKSHHLLHSDKSTYTALRFGHFSRRKVPNDKRPVLFSPEKRGFLEKMKSYVWPARLAQSSHNTYFYNTNGKIGNKLNFLYSNKTSTIPLVLSSVALLLVLGLSVGCVGRTSSIGGSNGIVYAENTLAEECNAGNTVLSLDMSGDTSLSTSVDNDISNGNISYLSKDFTVTACRTAGYKVYVQANSSKLQNQQAPDALFGVGENKSVTDFADNTWGYAVDEASKDNTAMIYNTMPEPSTSRTESYSEDTSTGATGKTLKITFAAKFGKDKVAGHYTSDVLMSVVPSAWDVVRYSVVYNGNGNTGGVVPQSQVENDKEPTHAFTVADAGDLVKSGYTFAGWAETANASAAQYQPGGTITLSKDSPTKTLYAVWTIPPELTPVYTWNELQYMQQMTPEACSTASGEKTLKDYRDGKSYTVRRLSDNKCWMTQNLDLDITAEGLKASDTDITADWNPGQTTITKGNLNTSTWPVPANTDSPTTAEANIVRSYDSGDTTNGNYYSWAAAKAGSTNTDPDTSICPKGWRLPTGGSSGEFQTLYSKGSAKVGNFAANSDSGYWLGGTANASGAAFFPASGIINYGILYNAGIYGAYWSSTVSSASRANFLDFGSSNVGSSGSYARFYGLSVRCVAR